jgi:hypothetical protein
MGETGAINEEKGTAGGRAGETFTESETHDADKEEPEETDTQLTDDNGGDTDTHAPRPTLEASLPTHAPTTVSSLQSKEAFELGELPELSTTTGAISTASASESTAACLSDLLSTGASESTLPSTGASESTGGRPAFIAAIVVPNPNETQ